MQLLVEETQSAEKEAVKVRVTPQELAQATAFIEARQNALAQHEAATIPIGEAVHQLNLEATPEEVLAEVQAQRAHTKLDEKRSTRPKSIKILTAIAVVQFVLLGLSGAGLLNAQRTITALRNEASANEERMQALEKTVQDQATALQAPKAVAPPILSTIDVQLLKSDKFRTLDIAESQVIRCNYDALESLAKEQQPAHVFTLKKPAATAWEVTRENGYFFVQCWTSINYAEKLINGHEGVVYPTKAGALDEHADTQIKLPVEAFRDASIHATSNNAPVAVVISGTP